MIRFATIFILLITSITSLALGISCITIYVKNHNKISKEITSTVHDKYLDAIRNDISEKRINQFIKIKNGTLELEGATKKFFDLIETLGMYLIILSIIQLFAICNLFITWKKQIAKIKENV